MKKRVLSLLLSAALLLTLFGCGEDTLLNKREPVTVTFWHVYGEQSGSPMDVLVQEFNRTVGTDKGVRVQVTNLSSAACSVSARMGFVSQHSSPEMSQ